MKIAFLMDQLYLHGGAERILSQKINYLAAHYQYEVHLITSEQRGKTPVYELHPEVQRHDLGINYLRERSYFSSNNLFKTARHFWRLWKAIDAIRPDILISVSYTPEQYFLPYMFPTIPKLKEFHSSRSDYIPSRRIKRLERVFDNYHMLVVLNADEQRFFPKHNTVVIPNFTIFEPVVGQAKQNTIIAAGRIAPVKQFDRLISIWGKLADTFPDWQLKIFGNGDPIIERALEQQIADLNIQQNTHLLAATDSIHEEMQRASIYAMTSSTECFPMVLLEAQACGLPIISYDCPTGPRHIVADKENGVLVSADDEKSFGQHLEKLLLGQDLRESMGKNALASAARFSQQTVMEQWHQLIQNIIKNTI